MKDHYDLHSRLNWQLYEIVTRYSAPKIFVPGIYAGGEWKKKWDFPEWPRYMAGKHGTNRRWEQAHLRSGEYKETKIVLFPRR